MERKKNGGLRFKRVFSDAAVAPFDQIEWERRTAEITDDGGQVRIGGELWSARPYSESQVIPVGSTVDVFAIEGATALVHPRE